MISLIGLFAIIFTSLVHYGVNIFGFLRNSIVDIIDRFKTIPRIIALELIFNFTESMVGDYGGLRLQPLQMVLFRCDRCYWFNKLDFLILVRLPTIDLCLLNVFDFVSLFLVLKDQLFQRPFLWIFGWYRM